MPDRRQYQYLESGINLLPEDKITPALIDYTKGNGQILGDQIAEQEKKKEVFNKLLDISLKDVKGRFRDEAIKAKQDAIKDVASSFAKADTITPQLMLKLSEKKDLLEGLAGQYTGIESWYKMAAAKAAEIQDPESRNATMENIRSIMEDSGSIKDTYQKITSTDWYVPPPEDIDPGKARDAIIKATDNEAPGVVHEKDPYGNVNYHDVKNKNQAVLEQNAKIYYNAHKPALAKQGFKSWEQWRSYVGTGKEYGNLIVRNANTTKNPKTKIIPDIAYNASTGGWNFPDKAIKLGGFQLTDSNGAQVGNRQNLELTQVVKDPDGKYYAIVTAPSLAEVNVGDLRKSFNDPVLADGFMLANGQSLMKADSKSQVNSDILKIPIDKVEDILKRNVNLHGFVYDLGGLGIQERYNPSLDTPVTEGETQDDNPLGLDLPALNK